MISLWQKLRFDIKVIGATVLIVGLVFLVTGWHTIVTERRILYEQIDKQGQSLVTLTSVSVLEALLADDYPILETIADMLAKEKNDIGYVRILRGDGKIVAEAPDAPLSLEPEGVRTFNAPVLVQADPPRPVGSVAIGILTGRSEAMIDTRIKTLGIAILAGFSVLSVALVVLLRGTVTNRLRSLGEQADNLGEGNLDSSVSVPGNDELATLGKILDSMRQRIQISYTEIQQARDKLTTIILATHEGIVVTDRQGKVVLINPAARELLDKTSEQIMREGFLQLLDHSELFRQLLNQGKEISREHTITYRNRILNVQASSIEDDDGKPIGSAALIRDVTAEKEQEEKLREIATTDALTGLYNRRSLDEILSKEFARANRYGNPLGVVMVDIDHFKRINDEFGHDRGDRILRAVGDLLMNQFRGFDYPCRYGGEEFCIIFPETKPDGVHESCERLRRKVEETRLDGLSVTISIGIATLPDIPTKVPEALVKAADEALYKAKREGRNRIRVAS